MPIAFQRPETNDPLATRFFQAAIAQQRLAHAYVLKCSDTQQGYAYALELAKLLNCEQHPTAGLLTYCGHCRNCRWIEDNAHPSVTTLTRLNYEVEGDKSTAKKEIRTGQISQLLQSLAKKSDDFRVVVFADAEERKLSANCPSAPWPLPPSDWRLVATNDGKTLTLLPITEKVFNAKSVNQFLKTLEEPYPRTLFLFLTNSEANLLPTVVSRCQVVPFTTGAQPGLDGAGFSAEEMDAWTNWARTVANLPHRFDPFPVIQQFEALATTLYSSPQQAVQGLQRWLRHRQLSGNTSSATAGHAYIQVQRQLAGLSRQLASKVALSAAMLEWLRHLAKEGHQTALFH